MMKTVKIIYSGTCSEGVVLEDGQTAKPGIPVDVAENIARKSEHRAGLLSRPDFKEATETKVDSKPKA